MEAAVTVKVKGTQDVTPRTLAPPPFTCRLSFRSPSPFLLFALITLPPLPPFVRSPPSLPSSWRPLPPSLPPTFFPGVSCCHCGKKRPISARFTPPPSLPSFLLPPPNTTFISSLPGDEKWCIMGDRRLSDGVSCALRLIVRDTANPECVSACVCNTCADEPRHAQPHTNKHNLACLLFSRNGRRRRRRPTRHVYFRQAVPGEYDLHETSAVHSTVYCSAASACAGLFSAGFKRMNVLFQSQLLS